MDPSVQLEVQPYRQIRADYDGDTIVVYQAYSPTIAVPAVENQRFVAPFSFERMTWIKPSFLWMMERCGYCQKTNQEHVLGVRITRSGFEQALHAAVLSEGEVRHAAVVVQWDPERNLRGGKLPYRAIQIGIGRKLIRTFVDTWIVEIQDQTPLVKKLRTLRQEGRFAEAQRLLPTERPYPVSEELAQILQMTRQI